MTAQPERKAQLIDATIQELGATGSLSVTVGQIARRAGVSSALAFHYFGDKDRLFLAAMRHILAVYGAEVRAALKEADSPRARLDGTIRASFSETSFRHDVIAAWLNFYVLAHRSDEARRLLGVYHRRLHANLVHDLRPLAGPRAPEIARRLAALIDGLYLRFVHFPRDEAEDSASAHVLAALDAELKALP
ncbi:transcriptional regulator BetI [Rhodovulum sp. BSW8]|uniref:HTH-type transcriptional regulator BetI n=1 Tax=Rhodovulum visakhapatnamense TaxID=364297 RepID=A0A4R8FWN0_9RHOB|nr:MULTISPECIES: transcriptional regulator BetI [Rhodovulum]OLS45683.1 transcriptional regulator BetI [Rhodovulum sulfidophilum]MBL3568099.1 transcriptional regulator BetI [Rhodovulum visakhapatnamense]MBL3577167.1 transcriptional regulator BetI [Rhodovulum visakhapatnamense]RBO52020.1 transcriptional regulator BetI [Rhodovulum sp. BSW8]TDX27021.1 TetR family transcriptional regulator [Rhodovulum visakhapatnamense]